MKKLLVLLAVVLLVAFAVPAAFAEVELGISATPIPVQNGDQTDVKTITGFHVGYAWAILYGTWDSLAMPAQFISNMTGHTDTTQTPAVYVAGPMVPGFLNLYDIGFRFMIRPFVLYAEIGTNSIYVYQPDQHPGFGGDFGANLRLGAGLRFGFWGVNLSGTSVFGSLDELVTTLGGLGAKSTRDAAVSALTKSLVPSLNVTFYF